MQQSSLFGESSPPVEPAETGTPRGAAPEKKLVKSKGSAKKVASTVAPAPVVASEALAPEPSAPTVYTVSDLTKKIKGIFTGQFADVWVTGEVSGFRPAASGHWYLQLKDENSLIKLVVWRGVANKCKFKVTEGMEIVVHGKIDLYAKRGEYQIVGDYIEPKGMGALQLAFEQLKAQLTKEGLFDPAHKKALPTFPKRIGIATSPKAAALQDMFTVIGRRYPGVDILFAPCVVQGDPAARSIAQAVELLDQHGQCDVIIVGRGGGSIEDLWAFNEEPVARAIFAASTPIVSAVGHEIDFSIADFVADLRAATPSAAAELVAPNVRELQQRVANGKSGLVVGLRRWVELRSRRVAELRAKLPSPMAMIEQYRLQTDHALQRVIAGMETIIKERRAQVGQCAAELQHLSPLAVLAKGYAVVTDAKKTAVRQVADIQSGDQLTVRLQDGHVVTQVQEIHHD